MYCVSLWVYLVYAVKHLGQPHYFRERCCTMVLPPVSRMAWHVRPTADLAAGIIYVSDTELGWQPLVASWLAKRKPSEAALLQPSFDRYVERMLQFVRCVCSGNPSDGACKCPS